MYYAYDPLCICICIRMPLWGACFVWCIFTKENQMDETLQFFMEKSATLNFLKLWPFLKLMLKMFSHFCIIVLLLERMCIGCRFKSWNFGSSSKGNKLMFLIFMFFWGFWVCSSVGWVFLFYFILKWEFVKVSS